MTLLVDDRSENTDTSNLQCVAQHPTPRRLCGRILEDLTAEIEAFECAASLHTQLY